MKWNLARKRALITGAASGIGRALALELARRQVHLCLVDRLPDELEETARACREARVFVTTCCLDLLDEDSIRKITDHARETLGGLDILINNAGIAYYGSFDRMEGTQCEQLLGVNLVAPLKLTSACLPLLLANEESRVLNVSSIFGYFPTRRSAAYHASKYGLLGFSLALRMEYARYGLGVICLCPGFVRTSLYQGMLRPTGKPMREPPAWISTTPEHVARVGISALRRNQRIRVVTWAGQLSWYAGGLWPALLDWVEQWKSRRPHPFAREQARAEPRRLP